MTAEATNFQKGGFMSDGCLTTIAGTDRIFHTEVFKKSYVKKETVTSIFTVKICTL